MDPNRQTRLLVLEINVTQSTLLSPDIGYQFDEESKEYIILEIDESGHQVGDIDYGYSTREAAERVVRKYYEHSLDMDR